MGMSAVFRHSPIIFEREADTTSTAPSVGKWYWNTKGRAADHGWSI